MRCKKETSPARTLETSFNFLFVTSLDFLSLAGQIAFSKNTKKKKLEGNLIMRGGCDPVRTYVRNYGSDVIIM